MEKAWITNTSSKSLSHRVLLPRAGRVLPLWAAQNSCLDLSWSFPCVPNNPCHALWTHGARLLLEISFAQHSLPSPPKNLTSFPRSRKGEVGGRWSGWDGRGNCILISRGTTGMLLVKSWQSQADFETSRQVLGIFNNAICGRLDIPAKKKRVLQDIRDLIPYPEAPGSLSSLNVKGKLGKIELLFLRSQGKCWLPGLVCPGMFPGRGNLVFYNSVALIHVSELWNSSGMTHPIHIGCFPCWDSPRGAARLKHLQRGFGWSLGTLQWGYWLLKVEID